MLVQKQTPRLICGVGSGMLSFQNLFCPPNRKLTDSKQTIVLRHGSYGYGKIEFQDFSRTFSFFKDPISSQFCRKQRDNALFFSKTRRDVKVHSISLILTQMIKTRTTAQIE